MTSATKSPSFDTCLFWLSPVVELDYAARGVYPKVRQRMAFETRSSGHSMHHLSLAAATEMLADAKVQRENRFTRRGLKLAYNGVRDQLKYQIEEAVKRVALASAPSATQTHVSLYSETWHGSRRQLEASGFTFDEALPGEDDSSKKSARAKDRRGYFAKVSRVDPNLWEGLFVVDVDLPAEHRERIKRAEQAAYEEGRQWYIREYSPATPDEFRKKLSDKFWERVSETLDELTDGSLGFKLDDESYEEAKDAASDAFYAILEGNVIGQSLKSRHAAMQRENARNDESLQRFIESCKPKGRVVNRRPSKDA